MLEQEENYTQEINLHEIFDVLARRKWIIIAVMVVLLSLLYFHLKRQVPFYQAQTSIVIDKTWETQSMVLPHKVNTNDDDYDYLETQLHVITTTPVISQAVKLLNMSTEPEGSSEFTRAVENLRGCVSTSLVNSTRIVNIRAKHHNAEKAHLIANAVAQAYIEQDRLSKLQKAQESIKWLNTQLVDLKLKIKKSEEAFQQFKEREGMLTFRDKIDEDLTEMSKLNSGYFTARTKRLEIESIINKLSSEYGEERSIPVALLDSPVLQRFSNELSNLQTQLSDKKRIFKDTYPEVIKLKERIKLAEQNIVTELKKQSDYLKAQEEVFLKQQDSKRQEAFQFSKKEMDYLALERDVSTNREIYNALLGKVEEVGMASDLDLSNISILEPAKLPKYPVSKKKIKLVVGFVASIVFALALSLFLEFLENTIRTPEDVAQYFGLPFLGIIPRVSKARRGKKIPPLVMQSDKKEASAEAFRTIRTNILATEPESPAKTILVTSASPGEGKSLTFVNLGFAMAQAGKKTLLIDADLRRPMVHKVFGLNRHRGLTKVLSGSLSLEEAIVQTENPNLSVLTTGPLPPNPSEVIGSPEMNQLIEHARENYDLVLFDSAPVLGMADTMVLAGETDAAILVIRTGGSKRKAIRVALDQLDKSGVKMAGVILNNADVKRDRYYNYYYYYYAYDEESGRRVKRRRKNQKNRISPVADSQKANIS